MEQTDLETLLGDIGVEVTRSTRKEIWAHCPDAKAHPRGDRNASWSINVDTGAHNCFSCGFRGSLRGLVQFVTGEVPRDLEDTIGRAALRRHIAGIEAKLGKEMEVEQEPEIFVSEYQLATYGKVPGWACDDRDLDPDDVDLFGVRWDEENERYIIPIRDFTGKLLGWQAKGHKYFRNVPKDMHKSASLFGLDVFMGHRAVLVESPLDAIRLKTAGIDGGVASYGAFVSDEQMSILIAYAETIVLALDHDKAGKQSTMSLIERYDSRARLRVVRYRPSDPKDIGEMSDGMIHRLLRRAVLPTPPKRSHRRRPRVHR